MFSICYEFNLDYKCLNVFPVNILMTGRWHPIPESLDKSLVVYAQGVNFRYAEYRNLAIRLSAVSPNVMAPLLCQHINWFSISICGFNSLILTQVHNLQDRQLRYQIREVATHQGGSSSKWQLIKSATHQRNNSS